MKFPALVFSADVVYLADSMSDISRASRLAVRSGFFKNIAVVDSDGLEVRVLDATKIRTIVPRPTLSDWIGFLTGNPLWQVQLNLSDDSRTLGLDEVKTRLKRSFHQQPGWWNSMVGAEGFQRRIVAAESLAALFEVFREYGASSSRY